MAEQPTLLNKWFDEVWNEGRDSSIENLMADHAVLHGVTELEQDTGPRAFRGFYDGFRSNFSNIHFDVQKVITDGDYQASLCTLTATDNKTGKQVKFSGISMVQVEDGKIVEAWNHYDFLGMYQQLGHQLVAMAE